VAHPFLEFYPVPIYVLGHLVLPSVLLLDIQPPDKVHSLQKEGLSSECHMKE